MKSLQISEMLLLSDLERRAKRVPFHPVMTVVLGKNDTGKSSVLKSIYRTFGAEPATLHPDWAKAEVSSLIKFSIDRKKYQILKKGDVHAIFDDGGTMVGRFDRITRGLGPFLADLFSFKLRLTTRENEIITPPPAYFFLPYYIDQDAGWSSNWASFARLGQIPKWRTSVVEYHTGIRPNEYYEAKAALQVAEEKLRRVNEESALLSDVREHVKRDTRVAEFDVSLKDFQIQLDELLVRCQDLLAIEERLKQKLTDLTTQRILIDSRRRIVVEAVREVGSDYHYAMETLVHDTVDCPTCGATYDNSFAERFAIARDEDRLVEMLFALDEEAREVDAELTRERAAFDDNRAEVREVQRVLAAQSSQVSLQMVLQSEGRKEVDAVFVGKLDETRKRQDAIADEADGQRARVKTYNDKDRKAEIVGHYQGVMRQYLYALNVTRLPESSYRRIDSKIEESGSDKPRALLAYFFSILHVMQRYSTTTFCPIVIDSPNQQAQDQLNLHDILEFIRDRVPTDGQVVLGLEDTYGMEFPGDVVTLDVKNKLLREDEYESARSEFAPLYAKAIEAGTPKRR